MPKRKKEGKAADLDWIASLARDTSRADGGLPSKEDRKRKRELKKNRRQLQKEKPVQKKAPEQASRSARLLQLSKPRLRWLSKAMQEHERRGIPYYDLPKNGNEKACRTSRGSNKAPPKRGRWAIGNSIQPRSSDYSGIGLARPTLYIEFDDPSYYPKLEEEFKEHIPGFYGKQRTKAMKKQTDGNMLWRRLAQEKNNKRFQGMNADERVQAMLDATDSAGLLG